MIQIFELVISGIGQLVKWLLVRNRMPVFRCKSPGLVIFHQPCVGFGLTSFVRHKRHILMPLNDQLVVSESQRFALTGSGQVLGGSEVAVDLAIVQGTARISFRVSGRSDLLKSIVSQFRSWLAALCGRPILSRWKVLLNHVSNGEGN